MVLSPLESTSPHIINHLMYLLVLVLPLCGAMVAGLFGRTIGSKGAGTVTSGCMVLSATVAGLIFYESAVNGSPAYLRL